LESQKIEAEQALFKLAEEVERLRSEEPIAPPVVQQVLSEADEQLVRSHHDKHMALLAKIDELREDLDAEKTRSRQMERRAVDAEFSLRKMSDIDRSRSGLDAGVTSRHFDMDASRVLPTDCLIGLSGEDALMETKRVVESKVREVESLEDETLRLREELNEEKQRVIKLKQAAQSRKVAWKEELQTLAEELGSKQRLEEEVIHLRRAHARSREEVSAYADREASSRSDADRLHQQLRAQAATVEELNSELSSCRRGNAPSSKTSSGSPGRNAEELEILTQVVGGQLVAVEQELTQQVQKNSQHAQLLDLFMMHAQRPLAAIRHACRQFAANGEAGMDMWKRQVPPMYEPSVQDLQGNLVKMVTLLRFAADVLEARTRHQQSDHGLMKGVHDSTEYATSWIRGKMET
jgi:chromosome segregation ATPase